VDTLEQPRDPVERGRFTSGDGRIIASVPFPGSLLLEAATRSGQSHEGEERDECRSPAP